VPSNVDPTVWVLNARSWVLTKHDGLILSPHISHPLRNGLINEYHNAA
jgi:hypothetical protein